MLLAKRLRDDSVRATEAIAKEQLFGAAYGKWRYAYAVRVVCDSEDESTCVLATPVANHASFSLRAALIIDVGIGPLHGIPQPGETGMKETDTMDADIGAVALEDADPADFLSVGLPVIEDDEVDAISTLDQFLAEEDLLTLGATDVRQILSA
jgi:hypothetical protein